MVTSKPNKINRFNSRGTLVQEMLKSARKFHEQLINDSPKVKWGKVKEASHGKRR